MTLRIVGAATAAVTGAVLASAALPAPVQVQGIGAKYGSRNPHTCASRAAPTDGPIAAAQAKQYFQCDSEKLEESGSGYQTLTLVTGVVVQVGSGRPFMMGNDNTGDNADDGIDPHFTVYPIRGSFVHWTCAPLDAFNSGAGRSCLKQAMPRATGICFMNSFKEWHCHMQDTSQPMQNSQPAPKGD